MAKSGFYDVISAYSLRKSLCHITFLVKAVLLWGRSFGIWISIRSGFSDYFMTYWYMGSGFRENKGFRIIFLPRSEAFLTK